MSQFVTDIGVAELADWLAAVKCRDTAATLRQPTVIDQILSAFLVDTDERFEANEINIETLREARAVAYGPCKRWAVAAVLLDLNGNFYIPPQ
jgi:hypothetical protein